MWEVLFTQGVPPPPLASECGSSQYGCCQDGVTERNKTGPYSNCSDIYQHNHRCNSYSATCETDDQCQQGTNCQNMRCVDDGMGFGNVCKHGEQLIQTYVKTHHMVAVMMERLREAIVMVQIIMVAPLHRQIRHRRNLNSLV